MAKPVAAVDKSSDRYGYTSSEQLTRRTPFQKFLHNFKRNWQLHLMIAVPLAYIIIFAYLPMYGIQIAFRDYNIKTGITGSPWVGLQHFFTFFSDRQWSRYVGNTLTISLYSLAAGFPIPIILALFLHVNEHPTLKKVTQNISYIPHFISLVVMIGIINQVFKPFTGLIASLNVLISETIDKLIAPGGVNGAFETFLAGIAEKCYLASLQDVRLDPDSFYDLYVWTGVWQSMGWSAIMYVAALAGVPLELHEAAKIDGASRWRRVLSVDLPAIMPTVCILLILRFGSIMGVGHEKIFLMQESGAPYSKSQVISTYVYRNGMTNANNYSFGSAVGLMNSVINTSMVLLVNWITNRLSDGESGLF